MRPFASRAGWWVDRSISCAVGWDRGRPSARSTVSSTRPPSPPRMPSRRSVRRWRPDVVVVSSISRVTWRRVRTVCRARAIPTALYLREAPAIGHLTAGLFPDLLLANSGTLVDDAARLGHHAALVPSVVRIDPMERPPTRDVAAARESAGQPRAPRRRPVGRRPARHPDRVAGVVVAGRRRSNGGRTAGRRPSERLVPGLRTPSRHRLSRRTDAAGATSGRQPARGRCSRRRPTGCPSSPATCPDCVEAVGEGGRLVAPDAGADEWIGAVGAIWDDESRWMALSERARMHAGPTRGTACGDRGAIRPTGRRSRRRSDRAAR